MDTQTPKETIVDKPEKPHKKKRVKMLRPSQILNKKRQYIDLKGEIAESMGRVEKGTKIFVTGPSYSGKSAGITKLCKAFAAVMQVDYNDHEEKGGDAGTVKKKLELADIDGAFDQNIRYYKAPIVSDTEETWEEILSKKRSAGFCVLDSVQHAELDKQQYLRITEKFCNPRRGKIMAFISHWVKNDYTKFLKHDCDVKIEIKKFVIKIESRLEGATNKPVVIWPEQAKKKWGKNYTKVLKGEYWPGD